MDMIPYTFLKKKGIFTIITGKNLTREYNMNKTYGFQKSSGIIFEPKTDLQLYQMNLPEGTIVYSSDALRHLRRVGDSFAPLYQNISWPNVYSRGFIVTADRWVWDPSKNKFYVDLKHEMQTLDVSVFAYRMGNLEKVVISEFDRPDDSGDGGVNTVRVYHTQDDKIRIVVVNPNLRATDGGSGSGTEGEFINYTFPTENYIGNPNTSIVGGKRIGGPKTFLEGQSLRGQEGISFLDLLDDNSINTNAWDVTGDLDEKEAFLKWEGRGTNSVKSRALIKEDFMHPGGVEVYGRVGWEANYILKDVTITDANDELEFGIQISFGNGDTGRAKVYKFTRHISKSGASLEHKYRVQQDVYVNGSLIDTFLVHEEIINPVELDQNEKMFIDFLPHPRTIVFSIYNTDGQKTLFWQVDAVDLDSEIESFYPYLVAIIGDMSQADDANSSINVYWANAQFDIGPEILGFKFINFDEAYENFIGSKDTTHLGAKSLTFSDSTKLETGDVVKAINEGENQAINLREGGSIGSPLVHGYFDWDFNSDFFDGFEIDEDKWDLSEDPEELFWPDEVERDLNINTHQIQSSEYLAEMRHKADFMHPFSLEMDVKVTEMDSATNLTGSWPDYPWGHEHGVGLGVRFRDEVDENWADIIMSYAKFNGDFYIIVDEFGGYNHFGNVITHQGNFGIGLKEDSPINESAWRLNHEETWSTSPGVGSILDSIDAGEPEKFTRGDLVVLIADRQNTALDWPIVDVNQGSREFAVQGDRTGDITGLNNFTILGSTGNDATYPLIGTWYNPGQDKTWIETSSAIPDPTPDGTLYYTSDRMNRVGVVNHIDGSTLWFAEPVDFGEPVFLNSTNIRTVTLERTRVFNGVVVSQLAPNQIELNKVTNIVPGTLMTFHENTEGSNPPARFDVAFVNEIDGINNIITLDRALANTYSNAPIFDTIIGVNQGNKTFTVQNATAQRYLDMKILGVDGSTGNDEFYHIVDVTQAGPNIIVEVQENIPDPTADGDAILYDFAESQEYGLEFHVDNNYNNLIEEHLFLSPFSQNGANYAMNRLSRTGTDESANFYVFHRHDISQLTELEQFMNPQQHETVGRRNHVHRNFYSTSNEAVAKLRYNAQNYAGFQLYWIDQAGNENNVENPGFRIYVESEDRKMYPFISARRILGNNFIVEVPDFKVPSNGNWNPAVQGFVDIGTDHIGRQKTIGNEMDTRFYGMRSNVAHTRSLNVLGLDGIFSHFDNPSSISSWPFRNFGNGVQNLSVSGSKVIYNASNLNLEEAHLQPFQQWYRTPVFEMKIDDFTVNNVIGGGFGDSSILMPFEVYNDPAYFSTYWLGLAKVDGTNSFLFLYDSMTQNYVTAPLGVFNNGILRIEFLPDLNNNSLTIKIFIDSVEKLTYEIDPFYLHGAMTKNVIFLQDIGLGKGHEDINLEIDYISITANAMIDYFININTQNPADNFIGNKDTTSMSTKQITFSDNTVQTTAAENHKHKKDVIDLVQQDIDNKYVISTFAPNVRENSTLRLNSAEQDYEDEYIITNDDGGKRWSWDGRGLDGYLQVGMRVTLEYAYQP